MIKPWTELPIKECGEQLIPIPNEIYCLNPHPYHSLGAPYDHFSDPWHLRSRLVEKLLQVENFLRQHNSHVRLALYDCWRPVKIQAFMVDYTIQQECSFRGLLLNDPANADAISEVVDEVSSFWAKPTENPRTPPPHSTGGAVDLTLCDLDGFPLDMGGKIDAIGPISQPNYFQETAGTDCESKKFHLRRQLLLNAMIKSGFVQHPNEWWHFSVGDQLWAWKVSAPFAIYGSLASLDNK